MHTHAKCVLGIASQLSWMGELAPEQTVRIPKEGVMPVTPMSL